MSRFKAAVQKDIKAVFLNLKEYGEWHTLNDVKVQCVIDKNLTQDLGDSRGMSQVVGVFLNILTIYVDSSDMPTPVEGEILSVDGSLHLVKSVSEEGGMLVIVAEANEQ
jgi:hypothetical protein